MPHLRRCERPRCDIGELEQPHEIEADQREQRRKCGHDRWRLQLKTPPELGPGGAQREHRTTERQT